MSSSEEAPATAAEVQEAMQRIVATFGPDTLRAFLQELPPRCLPDLLYISELSAQNGRHQANHGNGMIMAAIASTLRTSSSHANNNPALPALGEQEESQPQQQQPNPPPLNPNDLEPLPMVIIITRMRISTSPYFNIIHLRMALTYRQLFMIRINHQVVSLSIQMQHFSILCKTFYEQSVLKYLWLPNIILMHLDVVRDHHTLANLG